VEVNAMKATQLLHDLGQSLWLDNITRDLLSSGTLARYIAELSVTGLTSNPTIFDHAISKSTAYDAAIREKLGKVLAQRIIPELEGAAEPKLGHDSSTNALIRRYRKLRATR
jgi:Transaldolase/Fructose-6-phosphate aldolase